MPDRSDLAGAAMVPLLLETAFPVDRKMCACSTKLEILPDMHHLGKGDGSRSPVASLLRRSKFQGIKHSLKTKSAFGTFRRYGRKCTTNVWPFDLHLGEPPSCP